MISFTIFWQIGIPSKRLGSPQLTALKHFVETIAGSHSSTSSQLVQSSSKLLMISRNTRTVRGQPFPGLCSIELLFTYQCIHNRRYKCIHRIHQYFCNFDRFPENQESWLRFDCRITIFLPYTYVQPKHTHLHRHYKLVQVQWLYQWHQYWRPPDPSKYD